MRPEASGGQWFHDALLGGDLLLLELPVLSHHMSSPQAVLWQVLVPTWNCWEACTDHQQCPPRPQLGLQSSFPAHEPPPPTAVTQLAELPCLFPAAPGGKTKPPGSLGQILALQMETLWGELP